MVVVLGEDSPGMFLLAYSYGQICITHIVFLKKKTFFLKENSNDTEQWLSNFSVQPKNHPGCLLKIHTSIAKPIYFYLKLFEWSAGMYVLI